MRTILICGLILFVIVLIIPISIYQNRDIKVAVMETTQNEEIIPIYTDLEECLMLDTFSKEVYSIPLKEYLIGAVFAQIPADYEIEAIKAQAIIAHTYILRRYDKELNSPNITLSGAYFSNDFNTYEPFYTKEQAQLLYGYDYPYFYEKIEQAVEEVMNFVITYNEEYIIPVYHNVSAGKTESSFYSFGVEIPYLQSQNSPYDLLLEDNQKLVTLSEAELKARLSTRIDELEFDDKPVSWFKILEKTPADGVISIMAGGMIFNNENAYELQQILNLPSPFYDLTYKDGYFTFYTKGEGHGVGLSQFGANEMAKEGKTFNEILTHYYQDITISKISTLY